ncbi:MAG TPA: CHASE3 domain-containing protein [Gammaproteobacteria bacterium]|nr:CHASE3 domain-containing protein [Gammaproteobacteria bacterium]
MEDAAQVVETEVESLLPIGSVAEASSGRMLTAAFAAALALLVAVAILSYVAVVQNTDRARWVDHTYLVILAADKLLLDQQDTAAGERGYLLTGRQAFIDQYQQGRARIGPDIDAMAELTRDNPVQQQRIGPLRILSGERLQKLDRLIAEYRGANMALTAAQAAEVESSKQTMESLRSTAADFIQEERRLLDLRSAENERSQRQLRFIIAAGNLLSLGTLVICFLMLQREVRIRRAAEGHVHGLNESLTERAALLELANKELESFSYSISHDLRSPLRAIDGFSQILERSYSATLDAEGMRLLGVVRLNTKRMNALIEDLLAFSRLGRKTLDVMPLDMEQLVREAVIEVLADVEMPPQIVSGALPSCRGDRGLIKQVWINLIGNAVKYSGKRPSPRIEIDGREEQDKIVYTVRDNGVGFDMQYYDKLFGVFQRLHGVEEFSGTGVGLAIVMRIVTRHGGQVWAEAAVEEGAAFHFSLPPREEHHE